MFRLFVLSIDFTMKGEIKMYKKPEIVAQNKSTGSFAAGCPSQNYGGPYECKKCDRAQ